MILTSALLSAERYMNFATVLSDPRPMPKMGQPLPTSICSATVQTAIWAQYIVSIQCSSHTQKAWTVQISNVEKRMLMFMPPARSSRFQHCPLVTVCIQHSFSVLAYHLAAHEGNIRLQHPKLSQPHLQSFRTLNCIR